MKRKLAAICVALCTTMAVVACGGQATQGNQAISNDKITINQYKGLEVEAVKVEEITDEDVEERIQAILESKVTEKEIKDRPAADGDVVLIDYVGKENGVAFENGSDEDATLELGSNSFIDGFEEGIVGKKIGETFDLNLTFPESYHNADMAGKEVVFTVTLKGITEKIYPELTDELVKELSTASTNVEEYKKEIRATLEKEATEAAEDELHAAIWEAMNDHCTVKEYPEEEKQQIMDNLTSQYSMYASLYGVEVDELVQTYYGMTIEEMAKITIMQKYVIEAVAEKENLTVTDEIYQAGLAEYAEQYGYDDAAEFEEQVGKESLEEVLLQEVVTDWLADNCKQVEAKTK